MHRPRPSAAAKCASFLPVRGLFLSLSLSLSLSLCKANFIGCYKFRPFQSPNRRHRRRRRRQPTPRASRGGREGARCGYGAYMFSPLFRCCHLTLRSFRIAAWKMAMDASSVALKFLYASFEVEVSPCPLRRQTSRMPSLSFCGNRKGVGRDSAAGRVGRPFVLWLRAGACVGGRRKNGMKKASWYLARSSEPR